MGRIVGIDEDGSADGTMLGAGVGRTVGTIEEGV